MTSSCRILIALGVLATLSGLALAGDPPCGTTSLAKQLKVQCVRAPYCSKPAPCSPCYDFEVTCEAYCPKPMPCSPSYCFEWCTSIYCKKCIPCFPADPCERQVWHPAPCPAPCGPICPPMTVGQCLAF